MTSDVDDAWLLALGADVSDGRPVDWDAAERRASDSGTRRVVSELRRLSTVIAARSGRDVTGAPVESTIQGPQPALAWRHLVTIDQMGAGAFGAVYRAWDTRLEREVALKLLHGRPRVAPPRLDEARLLARVHHPNVVSVYGADEDDEAVGIWMELIEGRSLADLVEQQGPMSAREAAAIGLDLCRALAALHAAGLVHRDIKAQNVMREVGGRIVLMDFSGARDVESGDAPELLGTPLYMAPELFAGAPAGTATEIYSLGVLLFYLLSGRHPVEGATLADVRAAHAAGARLALRDLRPELSDAVVQIVERATARAPDARYRAAGDLERALLGLIGAGPDARATAEPTGRAGWRWAVAAGLALVAVAAAARWRSVDPPAAGLPVRFTLEPPYDTGSWPRVSPDGRHVVFGAPHGGHAVLWLRALDRPAPQPLAGTSGRDTPFWSPDSRTIAFFADEKLKRIALDRGAVQVLADAPQPRGGSWNRAGVLLFAPTPVSGLHRVRSDGTGLAQVTSLDRAAREFEHSWPEFLPDGRRYLFMIRSLDQARSGIYLGSLGEPGRRRVMPAVSRVAYADPGYLLYVRAGLLVARPFDLEAGVFTAEELPVAPGVRSHAEGDAGFDVSPAGVLVYRDNERLRPTRLVLVDRQGKHLGVVGEPALFRHPRFSPDGQRIVVERATSDAIDANLWVFDLRRGSASRLTRRAEPAVRPTWSPDGASVAFSSPRAGVQRVFTVQIDGVGEERPLVPGTGPLFIEGWLAEGALVVTRAREGIWRVPLDGRPPALLRGPLANGAEPQQPAASPDGRWLAYMAGDSGALEVYVEPIPPTGARWQVSTQNGAEPQWRADGKELYYLSGHGWLNAVEVSADHRGFRSGTPRPLFPVSVPELHGRSDYAASPDGQRFVVNTVLGPEASPAIHVALNWTALLPR